jgi:transcription antitermination factor NusG
MHITNNSAFDGSLEQEPVWCAVHTRYQQEMQVDRQLRAKGFDTFLPMFSSVHQWKDRKKEVMEALFPGYLFLANISEEKLPILTTPGVCSIVSIAGSPAGIPNTEIESIRRALASPYPVERHPYLLEGDWVLVQVGPLAGVRGIFVRKGKAARLVLSVEMLGRAAAVEIDERFIVPLTRKQPSNQLYETSSSAR